MNRNLEKWRKEFLILWTGQAASILTSSIIQMAIIWYLTDKTKSATVLSFATLLAFLPQALIGSFAGVFIDRYNRKLIMILADSFIALLTLGLVIVGFIGEIPVWFIMIVLFGRSMGSAFHNPSLQAIIPLLVPKDKLTQYAGYSQSFESISRLISPALAAALYSIWELHIIALLDIVGAILAILMLSFVKVKDVKENTSPSKNGYLKELKDGFLVMKQEKGMLTLVLISGLYAMIYSTIGNLYPLITMTYFGGTFVESSVVEVLFALGSLLGAFLLGIIGSKINKIKSIGRSIGVYGVGLLIIGLLPSSGFKVFAIISAIMGASVPFFNGIKISIFQAKFKPEYLGRVLSLATSLTMLSMPVGLILSGTFAERIGITRWFFAGGVGAVIIFILTLTLPSLKHCGD